LIGNAQGRSINGSEKEFAMFRKSSSFDSRYLLLSGAVAAAISAVTIGLLDSGYRSQRARATRAIGHYADIARRKVRKQRLQRRMREPEAIAAFVVSGLGLAAACARLVIKMRARSSPSTNGEDREKRRIETLENVIEVDRPLRTVYNQWTQFEEFPRFMAGVKEVRQLDDAHLLWRADVLGKEKEWESEITEQEPDTRISWKSVSGARNAGTVRFEPLGADRTRVRLTMAYEPENAAENIGDALGAMRLQVARSVQGFKEFIEGRKAATTGA
jgi:uncharacterized membrane protein